MSSSPVLGRPALPVEHLLAIFARLSLPTLLRLPLVGVHWATLQPSACRQRHSLSLLLLHPNPSSSRPLSLYTYSTTLSSPAPSTAPSTAPTALPGHSPLTTLTLTAQSNGTPPPSLVPCLLDSFPLLRTLHLENGAFSRTYACQLTPEATIRPFARLLAGYSATLTRLSIFGFDATPSGTSLYASRQYPAYLSLALLSLLSTINGRLLQLRHLVLSIKGCLLPPDRDASAPASLRLSVLGRLASLSFQTADRPSILLPSLEAYLTPRDPGPGGATTHRLPHLSELRLGDNCPDTGGTGELLISLAGTAPFTSHHHPLLRSLTHLHLGASSQPLLLLRRLYVHLQHTPLRCLSVALCPAEVHPCLGLLAGSRHSPPHLRALSLTLLEMESTPVGELMRLLEEAPRPLASHPRITSLRLTPGDLHSHGHLHHLLPPLSQLFPALATFQLNALPAGCSACWFSHREVDGGGAGGPWGLKEAATQKRACLRRLLAALLDGCTQLRAVLIPDTAHPTTTGWSVTVWEAFPLERLARRPMSTPSSSSFLWWGPFRPFHCLEWPEVPTISSLFLYLLLLLLIELVWSPLGAPPLAVLASFLATLERVLYLSSNYPDA